MNGSLRTLDPARPAEAPVVFEEVARHQWRVLDAGLPAASVDALLGFVCHRAGLYEVTTMAEPLGVSYFADLDAAHAAFHA